MKGNMKKGNVKAHDTQAVVTYKRWNQRDRSIGSPIPSSPCTAGRPHRYRYMMNTSFVDVVTRGSVKSLTYIKELDQVFVSEAASKTDVRVYDLYSEGRARDEARTRALKAKDKVFVRRGANGKPIVSVGDVSSMNGHGRTDERSSGLRLKHTISTSNATAALCVVDLNRSCARTPHHLILQRNPRATTSRFLAPA